MGKIISSLYQRVRGNTRAWRVLMVGLDNAGKTTILYRLKLGETDVPTIPTVGFNVETIQYLREKFTVWDVGATEKIRPLWRHYFDKTDAVIFVVDSGDRKRMVEAREELTALLADRQLRSAPLCVFANKQDLSKVMPVDEMAIKLGLNDLRREWTIVCACGQTGTGLHEGLEWLSWQLNGR